MSTLTIIEPVVDLRSEPKALSPHDFSHNDLRLTQLLYGDSVTVIKQEKEWLFVKVSSQKRFSKERQWHFYEGWIPQSGAKKCPLQKPTHVVVSKDFVLNHHPLSFGSYLTIEKGKIHLPTGEIFPFDPSMPLRALSLALNKQELIKDALLFLEDPYLWGGTSSFHPKRIASVDCSGLIYLIFRAQNIVLARDAHDQWLQSQKVSFDELEAGDLLFLSRQERPDRITHVLLYLDEGRFLEAPQTHEKVRAFTMKGNIEIKGNLLKIKGRDKIYIPHFSRISSSLSVEEAL